MRHVTQARTALAEQAVIACPNPYGLLGPVRVLRKDLNLTSNDVTVLTALNLILSLKTLGEPRG